MTVVDITGHLPAKQRDEALSKKEIDMLVAMFKGYDQYAIVCHFGPDQSLKVKTAVQAFVAHSGKAPWNWNQDDYIAWQTSLAEKTLARESRRSYQQRVNAFCTYMCTTEKFVYEIKRQFGVEVRNIITADVRLRHKAADDTSQRPEFTEAELAKLTAHLRKEIALAIKDGAYRCAVLLQRDLAMFSCLKLVGSRVGGLCSMNTDSFAANPDQPDHGKYGVVLTIEKGAHGSGRLPHTVVVDDTRLPEILRWYEEKVRPKLVHFDRPRESAMWLTQTGTRITYKGLWVRFRKHLNDCGLGGKHLSPHCTRHGRSTERTYLYGITTARDQNNHGGVATTMKYVHIKEDHARADMNGAMDKQRRHLAERRAKRAASKQPTAADETAR